MSARPFTLLAALLAATNPVAAFWPYHLQTLLEDLKSVRARDGSHAENAGDARPAAFNLPLRRTQLKRQTRSYTIIPAVEPSQEGSAGVDTVPGDYTYMIDMKFGSSDKEFHMLVDTAASNTWVMSSDCTTDVCASHNTLADSDSTSLELTDRTFSQKYGSGEVAGKVGEDTVSIAEYSVSLTFGLGTEVSDAFASYALDGILALGRGKTSNTGINAPLIVEALAAESKIPAKVIGIHLARSDASPQDSELNIGTLNEDRYEGDLTYVDAADNKDGMWQIPCEGVGVDGEKADLPERKALLDTGTSYMIIPPDDAAKIHDLIPGSRLNKETEYAVPCDTKQSLQFTFGGKTFDVSADDWIGGDATGGGCVSLIVPQEVFGSDSWLMGIVFLKSVYAVFDYDETRVGFAVKKSGDDSSPTESDSPTSTSELPSSQEAPQSSDTPPQPTSLDDPLTTSTTDPTESVSDSAAEPSGSALGPPSSDEEDPSSTDSSPSTSPTSASTGAVDLKPSSEAMLALLVAVAASLTCL